MTGVLAGLVAGVVVARLAWWAARPVFASPALARPNYRGHVLPTAAGIVLPVAAVVVEAGRAAAEAIGGDRGGSGAGGPRVLVLAAAAGFALLGLVDDVAGTGAERGFRGHLRALGRGRLTTGGLKLIGGAALAVAVVAPRAGGSPARLLADAALVALAANLGNLFDRAPGRTVKVGLVAFAALALGAWDPVLAPVAVVVGAAAGLLPEDLHERLMLGDAGANALGGVLGLGVVLACAPSTRVAVLVVVALLNGAAELVSFSRVIGAVPPLRALDRLGRIRATAP